MWVALVLDALSDETALVEETALLLASWLLNACTEDAALELAAGIPPEPEPPPPHALSDKPSTNKMSGRTSNIAIVVISFFVNSVV